jgi:hypothetical protein
LRPAVAKAFYASAVLTLALGMAGVTVMLTLVRGIRLRPLPVPDEERLVVSWRVPRSVHGNARTVSFRGIEAKAQAATTYNAVGIGGCQPPQPAFTF